MITSGEPRILEPEKCAEIGWFAPDQMPEGLTMITRINLEHYRQRIKPEIDTCEPGIYFSM